MAVCTLVVFLKLNSQSTEICLSFSLSKTNLKNLRYLLGMDFPQIENDLLDVQTHQQEIKERQNEFSVNF